jgi:hypothetical protein
MNPGIRILPSTSDNGLLEGQVSGERPGHLLVLESE